MMSEISQDFDTIDIGGKRGTSVSSSTREEKFSSTKFASFPNQTAIDEFGAASAAVTAPIGESNIEREIAGTAEMRRDFIMRPPKAGEGPVLCYVERVTKAMGNPLYRVYQEDGKRFLMSAKVIAHFW
jgi:hypothetical protein